MTSREHGIWSVGIYEKANRNIQKWGIQDRASLIIAMTEELGELAQAHLKAVHEGGDECRIEEEIDDLAALCVQLRIRIQQPTNHMETAR